MTSFSTKTAALAAVIALGSLMSSTAHAAILHTADGGTVTTKDGAPVLVQDQVDPCEADAAARAAQLAAEEYARERTVYFDFNKSALTKAAKTQLTGLAAKIRANKETNVAVVGYADRMGNAAYNERLALKRAKAVRDYLVAKGVKAKKVEVRSLGKSAPKANCAAEMPRAQMIQCLSEDRRVEIETK